MYSIKNIFVRSCRKNVFSRSIGFQALKINLDHNEPSLQTARKKSEKVSSILKLISSQVKAGGGPKSIHRHTVVNKKIIVRDRLKLLLDPDSPILEIGLLSGLFMDYGSIPCAATIVVIGKIHGKFCIIGANDATVKGGTFFPITVTKQMRMQELAILNKLPCIYIVDSGGAFLPLQAEIFPDQNHGGRAFYNEAVMSSMHIPQIAVVCGSSTAGGAYCPTMAEEAIIVKNSGILFLAGPPLVKAATGEIVSEQDLGGADTHCRISGCTDYFADTEEEAFLLCRESVLTLNESTVPLKSAFEEPLFPQTDLSTISGKDYLIKEDMYIILSRILDGSNFKEFKSKFGFNLIAGFGYLHGFLIGVLANSGPLTYQDAQKGAHFIQICEKRKIPLVFLQNSGNPQHFAQEEQSSQDFVNCRAKMVAIHSCASVPKITVCVGGCYEDDNFTMCGRSFEPNFFFTWPLSQISATKLLLKDTPSAAKILNASTPPSSLEDFEELFENVNSSFFNASRMQCDSVIPPEKTREILALSLEIVSRLK